MGSIKVTENNGMGKFERGQSMPLGAGRKKGTKNNRTIFLGELLTSNGVEPALEIIKLIPLLNTEKQLEAWQSLMPYSYSKPISSSPDGEIEVIPELTNEEKLQEIMDVQDALREIDAARNMLRNSHSAD